MQKVLVVVGIVKPIVLRRRICRSVGVYVARHDGGEIASSFCHTASRYEQNGAGALTWMLWAFELSALLRIWPGPIVMRGHGEVCPGARVNGYGN